MLLKELIKEIENLDIRGSTNIKVNNVSKNSNEIKPGDLFVAIKGSKSDGHDFINDAIIKGAKCILSEKIIDKKKVPLITRIISELNFYLKILG